MTEMRTGGSPRLLVASVATAALLGLTACSTGAPSTKASAGTNASSSTQSSNGGASGTGSQSASRAGSTASSSSTGGGSSSAQTPSAGSSSANGQTSATPSTPAKDTFTITRAYPSNGATVGNAQPIVIHFDKAPKDPQAVVERLKVTDTYGSVGAWRWITPTRLDYRPKSLWPVGDRVTVTGDVSDLTSGAVSAINKTWTVTSDLAVNVNLKAFTMTVSEGGKVIRTMKVDSGKKGMETLTGNMVILGKSEVVHMTSCSVGLGCSPSDPEYYSEDVPLAVQISTSGIYIHSAPWDNAIGKVNSSHGCIHLSPADAQWFYSKAIAGALVTVTGDGNRVAVSNGEGDWNLTWAQWLAPEAS